MGIWLVSCPFAFRWILNIFFFLFLIFPCLHFLLLWLLERRLLSRFGVLDLERRDLDLDDLERERCLLLSLRSSIFFLKLTNFFSALPRKVSEPAADITPLTKIMLILLFVLSTTRVILELNRDFLASYFDVVQSTLALVYLLTASVASTPFKYSTKAKEYSLFLLFLTTISLSFPYSEKRVHN